MRILTVRFKNLNSLAGEWQVDFSGPEYVSDGIFAITGPTGAGKTTILDAVCLGLYGRTPRLDRVTKNSNEIISRQTGECFAEVTFETQKGRYRSHWSQHRARKKPEGELQPARHEIVEADSGTVLESKLSRVSDFVENVTGMDFGRFTRSMMLAQGQFAAFLNAPGDERAPILEQITGSEIYSLISIGVHERRKEERDTLDLLNAELKGIEIFGEDKIEALETNLKEIRPREKELEITVKGFREAAVWVGRVAALERDSLELDEKLDDLNKRWQAFEPDLKRLERAKNALGLEGDYTGVDALRSQQFGEMKALDDSRLWLPGKEKGCADALSAKKAAEIRLIETRNRQQAEAQVIKKVREFDTRLIEQEKQVEEREGSISAAEKQAAKYQKGIKDLEQSMERSAAVLKAAKAYQARHAPDAALLTDLSAIDRGFSLFRDCEAKHDKALKAVSKAVGENDAALLENEKIEGDHEKSRLKFEKKETELKELTKDINALLKGRDIGRLRDKRDGLKDGERLLHQAGDIIDRIDRTGLSINRLKAATEKLHADRDRLAGEMTSAKDIRSLLEKDTSALETEVSLRGRIRDLEGERKRLEDDKPCPLCGAADHPFARGNVPELDEAETALVEKRAELKSASERVSKLESKQVRVSEGIRHTEKEVAEKRAAQDTDEKEYHGVLLKLNLDIPPESRAEKIREEIASTRAKISETAGIVEVADEKNRKEKAIQSELEKLRRERDALRKTLQDARHKLEKAGLDHGRLVRERDVAVFEVEKMRDTVLSDVKPFGILQLPSSDLDAIANDLIGRKNAWQANQDEKTGHEKKIGDLKAEILKITALLDSLEKELVTRREARDKLVRQYSELAKSRQALFGEKETDQEEKRLAEAISEAEKSSGKSNDAHGLIEKEISVLKERIGSLKDRTEKRTKELAQVTESLNGRIRKAGFKDEADFLSAHMSDGERGLLADREKAFVKEKTELDARKKDKIRTLTSERNKRLTEATAEGLAEKIGTGESELRQIRIDIGGIEKSLGDNEEMRKKQKERLKNIDAQRQECARWDDLHQLIGSADGKKFRNFAQGLTFEMVTAQANRQLKKMTDRYLLIRDASQPLELNVIDRYQAGEIRSTKNLSGGESFIVSLALALGLSHMAGGNVRVDSLFLDEGFGTLDDEALETALEALAELQQDGKLIGVISHVTALKERIGTQIQVIAGTGGRSSISGPGCRRI
jgi:DNA repair protein SbcC/Rad50